MKRLILVVLLILGLAAPAWGGFAEGVAAYERGDYATALKEFLPRAEQGYATAQYNLGVMYVDGLGVPEDYIQAHMWFNLAAAQGDQTRRHVRLAAEYRDKVAKLMTREQIAEAQRLAREWRPMEAQ